MEYICHEVPSRARYLSMLEVLKDHTNHALFFLVNMAALGVQFSRPFGMGRPSYGSRGREGNLENISHEVPRRAGYLSTLEY